MVFFAIDNQRAAAAQAARIRSQGRHDRPLRDGGDLRYPGRLRRGADQDYTTQRYVHPPNHPLPPHTQTHPGRLHTQTHTQLYNVTVATNTEHNIKS